MWMPALIFPPARWLMVGDWSRNPSVGLEESLFSHGWDVWWWWSWGRWKVLWCVWDPTFTLPPRKGREQSLEAKRNRNNTWRYGKCSDDLWVPSFSHPETPVHLLIEWLMYFFGYNPVFFHHIPLLSWAVFQLISFWHLQVEVLTNSKANLPQVGKWDLESDAFLSFVAWLAILGKWKHLFVCPLARYPNT